MCGRTGALVSTATCRAFSPTLPSGQQVFVNERSPASTQASPAIVATVLSESIPVTFVINSQGPAPYNDTFTIGLCSGYLFVNNVSLLLKGSAQVQVSPSTFSQPANIILTNVPTPSPLWVNISAVSGVQSFAEDELLTLSCPTGQIADLDPTTAVWAIVNVTLLPVPLPPVFNQTALSLGYTVAEGWSGSLFPPIVATDPQVCTPTTPSIVVIFATDSALCRTSL